MMEVLLDILRFVVYTWGLYEVGMLTSFYYICNKNETIRDKYSLQVLVFSSSVLFMIVVLMVMNILGQLFPHIGLLLRNGLILPVVAVAVSAKFLKRRYLE